MEQGGSSDQKVGSSPAWRLRAKVVELAKEVKKIGEDDPRRIVHSLKVGMALTLVSIFYYVTPLFNGFGVSAMWAVLTVVVVMEYTVGGTLGKGVNRGFATLVASALGVGAHQLAVLSGEKGEPILLGIFVFLLSATATYSRFIPEIKARYDYGVIIFILTFSLVAVSSYREEELLQLAHQRLSTIAIGVGICLFSSIFVFPVWAGEDLHKLVALNLEKLARFLEGLGTEYFGEKKGSDGLEGMPFLQSYKSVLNSKPTEETLANFARWEPGHARFGFRHPWTQYLKIGTLCRQCAYSMEALNAYILTSEKIMMRRELQIEMAEMSRESSKALTELALGIRTMTTVPCAVSSRLTTAAAAAAKLKTGLSKGQGSSTALDEILHLAVTISLVEEIIQSVRRIAESVDELARIAHFKSSEAIHRATVKPLADGDASPSHLAISIEA